MSLDSTWNRVEHLFSTALELPEAEREAYVRGNTPDDPGTRDEVLKLLGAREQMGDFLEAPMLDFRNQAFGRYCAREEIGRGGMSVVYRGERVDGDFEKQVAIKVILLQAAGAIRTGETQILARLEHPNVARLLDSGLTAQGFRYLVMELVEGKPCTEFSQGFTERQKLRLFLQICAGVQAAHRAMVVHRDLKPDNILVTPDGTVKLLDFGIAKVLDIGAVGQQTTGIRAFTPDYASPEQILGHPATAASDIYSLGVLLCELVGGSLPRTLAGMNIGDLVRQAEQESTADNLPLRGDMAAIAGKAMRRDPEHRYASASELARDVERYLEGQPIEARAPTWSYHASRFLARNRFVVAGAALAFLALAVTAAFAAWQARLASQRFDLVRNRAGSVLFDVTNEVSKLPGSLNATQLIVDRSLKYFDALASDRFAPDQVRIEVVRGYLRLAEIQGKDFSTTSLLKSGDALLHAQKGLAMARQVVARRPTDIEAKLLLLKALDYVTSAHLMLGDTEKGLPLGDEAVQFGQALLQDLPGDLRVQDQHAGVLKQLAKVYDDKGDHPRAIELFRRALALRKEIHAAKPGDRLALQRLAEGHNWLTASLVRANRVDEAEPHAREAYRLDQLRYQTSPKLARGNLASDLGMLAVVAARKGRQEEQIALYQEQLRLRREIAAEDPGNVGARLRAAASLNRIGYAYQKWGKYPEAVRFGVEALAEVRRIQKAAPRNAIAQTELIFSLSDLATTYHLSGQRARACQLAKESLAVIAVAPRATMADVARQTEKVKTIVAACGS
jgi:serine/threonine protein kinase